MFAASSDYSDPAKRPKLVVTYQPMKKYFYLKDHLGNIRVTVDENGDVKGYNDYYPFGLTMPGRSMNTALNYAFYKFSSKELDEENDINWYYFGARYYDPEIGRWWSVDPLAEKIIWLTPYNYARNNPIIRFDLYGLSDLVFNRSTGKLILCSGNGNIIGIWEARNNVASSSNGRFPLGTYKFAYFVNHAGEGVNSPYGNIGNFVFDVPGRSGMGVHAGRENVPDRLGRKGVNHCTMGCIRTTDEAMKNILNTHNEGDPLKTITVMEDSEGHNEEGEHDNKGLQLKQIKSTMYNLLGIDESKSPANVWKSFHKVEQDKTKVKEEEN
ncbi:RHS repeat-associated core domain-containing protein [Caldithrix abyssi DSM 13497]|uniref:RHS repeat-associated core domain-containing protein n=2 Tax=Caldithrix abyssi DSM 13497 TaxID=880073 RepID=H1XVW1_CALAY|nr:RHS repeat-associated core domain-containing protein [Caldithrix abyssi DSM 13497]